MKFKAGDLENVDDYGVVFKCNGVIIKADDKELESYFDENHNEESRCKDFSHEI